MVHLRPVRFGSDEELGRVAGAGTVDPYDTLTSAQQFWRAQRPYSQGTLWVGRGLMEPKLSAIDLTMPLVVVGVLGVFFLMK